MARTSVAKPATSKAPKTEAKAAGRNFASRLFRDIDAKDDADLTNQRRATIAQNFWHFMQQRKPRQVLLRVYNPTEAENGWKANCTVVEVVQEDCPFIIDSTMGAINHFGLAVHRVIHPILRVRRDGSGQLQDVLSQGAADGIAESCTHIQCDEIRDPQQLKVLTEHLHKVYADVRAAVADWQPMLSRIDDVTTEIAAVPDPQAADSAECRQFLHWLRDNNFTFLGYRTIDLKQQKHGLELVITPGSGLGILRQDNVFVFNNLRDLAAQPPEVQAFMQEPRLLLITKTNLRATVHRSIPMDAIFIKRFDAKGRMIGEHLFVGLFTSFSYSRSPREIPLLRQKVDLVLARAGCDPVSHDGKAMLHILDNYPRDDMFQINETELLAHARGILRLQERQRLALFLRSDPFGRFVNALIYVPRDQYDSTLRRKFCQVLEATYAGRTSNFDVRMDSGPLARIHISVATTPSNTTKIDTNALEQELRDIARPWSDQLRDALHDRHGDQQGRALAERYHVAFAVDYREATRPEQAVQDIATIESMGSGSMGVCLSRLEDEPGNALRLRIYHRQDSLALSQLLPVIENLGLFVSTQNGPYVVTPHGDSEIIWLYDIIGTPRWPLQQDFAVIKPLVEETFRQVWANRMPNDGFNQLVLRAALPGRSVNVLRTLAKYAHQIKAPQSREAMIGALVKHTRLAQIVIELFTTRHDPATQRDAAKQTVILLDEMQSLLAQVPNLDEDRILRRFANLVQASLRTNFYQNDKDGQPKDYLSIKFDCAKIEGLPLPRPVYEIFVVSPRVEAVHLRGGKVARGGIRWSDRHDDFRTEILGLMKAQMVKNSVIVPVGAKGGFIIKQPDAQNPVAEAIACYQTMMRGLLDITDNQKNGKIVPPANVVRHDGDDAYLVVAADKGTAKFSDIANGVSAEYGFWLGDAFASGGSAGYDHKHMGITARGAWEAIKRHFREMGKDIQQEDFTCIGVGDMSGDVFGNGMLLSPHIRLLGAFDHRHIFCDPNPDATKSFAERQRLFNLPTSSWADYDAKLIAKGGGIFARSLKTITITPAMKAAYGIVADTLTPAELMQAMLKAQVELLYFGGIGTYVKASSERDAEVGDRANDALRVDGGALRAKVIGEGANLAMTQRARIEYALNGGRINTDAIDNSAGVDTSDHEVNIKIALNKAVLDGKLDTAARNKLLSSMTDDVADLVLRDNYMQTQALSLTEASATDLLSNHARVLRMMERGGLLNRGVEFLPDDDALADRQRLGRGLTRPELAVLMAYAKIWLYQQLLATDLPDDGFVSAELLHYFPPRMREKYLPYVEKHQLRREIIATAVTNSLINHAGIHFVMRMTERTGNDAADVTRAYLLTREAFGLLDLWRDIRHLDNKIPTAVQTAMRTAVNLHVLRRCVPWFLAEHGAGIALEKHISHYRAGVTALESWLQRNGEGLLDAAQQAALRQATAQGVPTNLAARITLLPYLAAAPDLQSLAQQTRSDLADVAEIYFRLEQQCGFGWLRARVQMLPTPTAWQRDAAVELSVEAYAVQRRLTAAVLKHKGKNGARHAAWSQLMADKLRGVDLMLQELRAAASPDLAMLTMAVKQLAALGN